MEMLLLSKGREKTVAELAGRECSGHNENRSDEVCCGLLIVHSGQKHERYWAAASTVCFNVFGAATLATNTLGEATNITMRSNRPLLFAVSGVVVWSNGQKAKKIAVTIGCSAL